MIVGLVIGAILLYVLLGAVSFGFFRILLGAEDDDGGILTLISVIWPISIIVAVIFLICSYVKPFFCFFEDFGSRLGHIAGNFASKRERAMTARRERRSDRARQRYFSETGTSP